MLKNYLVLVVCLLAFAAAGMAADCEAPAGDYVLRLSGFGGGSPNFYPIAVIGNMTVKDGDASGNMKILAPMAGGTKENRNFTGKLAMKNCVGTLTVKDGSRTVYTFTVLQGKGGALTLALGDLGLIISGSAEQ